MLFDCIQKGVFELPCDDWKDVSDEARDLISHLLVRDPHQRYSAAEVVKHPWITMESPKAQLATPRVLQR